jgi:hypothetical protein
MIPKVYIGPGRGELTEENLKVVLAKFSTLSQAVFVLSVIEQHGLVTSGGKQLS